MDDWKWYDYYEFYVRMVVVSEEEEDAWSWLSLWNGDPSSSFVLIVTSRKGTTWGYYLLVGRYIYILVYELLLYIYIQIVSQC